MDATRRLAEFTHDLTAEALPAATIEASGRMALDTVGAAIAAWDAPGVRELRAILSQWGAGPSRVWIAGERLSPPAATLVNSSMAHALEYDDLHSELPIHSGVVMVPAVLAVAEARQGVTGADAAAALVAGTEVICRLARATNSYFGDKGFRGWNPSSVVAGFGTAAAAAKLLGLDADGIERALGLAYAQASGNQQCIEDGGLVKRMQPAMVAEAGVRAAWLAEAGVTGAVNAIEGRNGFFSVYEGGDYDAAKLTDGLGDAFEIDGVGFKRYPICGMAHPAVDVLRGLKAEHGFTADEVDSVEVFGSKFVKDMVGRPYRPGNNPEVDAQFSLGYCLASILLTGNITLADLKPEHTLDGERRALADLEPEHTLDSERRALADRIPIHLDETLKGKWTARVEVTLRDGQRLSDTRAKAGGQSDSPLTTDELVAKFADANAAGGARLAGNEAGRLAALLLELAKQPSLQPICDALVPAEPVRRAG